MFLHHLWSGWRDALIIVKPETVIRIHRARRRIVHIGVTPNPTAVWVRQRLREAFPVIVLGERHLAMEKDRPVSRRHSRQPDRTAKIIALPRVGGLHHRYEWRTAA